MKITDVTTYIVGNPHAAPCAVPGANSQITVEDGGGSLYRWLEIELTS